ncbi:unnamed protein product [Paramecium sonneborni]|uniref:Uncharacterized protein n=1 Tax=Paramecium sonneborni TaxID=65129 RepID=A0A8S1QIW4_9CILI|nr:unnamed protein product [Paramecium sonneborni]
MPKVKQLYGLSQISAICKSPKSTSNRLNGSQTQPASNRINLQYEAECDRKDCMIIKWNGIQMQHQLQHLQKELDKYKSLYVKERKKIADTYKEIEEIMNAITKKEKDLKKKESQIADFEQQLQSQNQQNDSLSQSLKALNKQLTERETQLQQQENNLNQQAKNQNALIDDLNNLKCNLESSVKFLEQKESQLFASLQDLNQQEQDTMKRVEHINQFLKNSNDHQSLMLQIEQLFREKTQYIQNVKESVLQRQDELQYYEQQLQLRSVCASANEAAFMKRVAETERMNQKTPTQESNKKLTRFTNINIQNVHSNQKNNNILDNQLYSTLCSRENSPISNKESFKLIKKPYLQHQMPMSEINNFDIKN